MKPKTLILLVVAVTCGLGASYMTSRLLAERQPEESEKVSVLVAKKNIDMGITIKKVEDLFEEKKFTVGEEPKNAIVKFDDLKARVLKRSLRAGDFVTGDDLLSDKDGTISTLMAQGYRAIGIRVNIADIASGFASLPMSHVDLIWTVRRATDKDSKSSILLEDVLVLAADTQTQRAEGNGAMPASVVTVMLRPEDILKVSMARELGSISMVLRKFNDHQKADVNSVSVEELLTGTAGKKDTEDDSWVESTQQPKVAKGVDLPELPKETVDVAKVDVPKGKLHRLHLIEGDQERVVEYWLDEKGEVVHNDVTRTEIAPAPPRPPQTQPRQPQGQQPQTQQPQGQQPRTPVEQGSPPPPRPTTPRV